MRFDYMAQQKKKKKRTRAQKKESRIARAKNWLPTYEGSKIVRAYRDKFNVNTECAVRELLEIGYKFEPGYVENLLRAEAIRIEQLRKKKDEKREAETYNEFQDDKFFFIAGYTSGGAPYGVQWWEIENDNIYEGEDYDDDMPEKKVPAVPVVYSELDEEKKEEVFSRMAEMIDDFFRGSDYIPEKEDMDDIMNELCDEMSEIALVQDDSMRSAFNGIIEQIISECKEDGIEIPTFLETLTVTGTERLTVRRFCRNDTDNLFDLMKNPEAMRNFENVFIKKKEARKWINHQLTRYHKDGYGYFAVTLKDTDKLIGQTGIIQTKIGGGKSAEIGYIFDNTAFEQGYAVEAVQAFFDWAFDRYTFERLYCKIRSENETAAILAEQLRMLKTDECAVTEKADGSFGSYVLERKIN